MREVCPVELGRGKWISGLQSGRRWLGLTDGEFLNPTHLVWGTHVTSQREHGYYMPVLRALS